jgi:hypothetical protein
LIDQCEQSRGPGPLKGTNTPPYSQTTSNFSFRFFFGFFAGLTDSNSWNSSAGKGEQTVIVVRKTKFGFFEEQSRLDFLFTKLLALIPPKEPSLVLG